MMPGKSIQELRHHYEFLEDDVAAIEAGAVPLPSYITATQHPYSNKEHFHEKNNKNINNNNNNNNSGPSLVNSNNNNNGFSAPVSVESGAVAISSGRSGKGGSSKSEQERHQGIPWTEEEHGLFLLGLDKFGKGDWRSISRNFVISRTPTQVASHVQKYFIRLNSLNRERRRSSIDDISSISGDVMSTCPHYHHNQHQQHPPEVKQGRPNGAMNGLGNLYGGGPIRHPVLIPTGHHFPPLSHRDPHHHAPSASSSSPSATSTSSVLCTSARPPNAATAGPRKPITLEERLFQ